MRRLAAKPLIRAGLPYAFLLAEVLFFYRRVLFSLRAVIPFDIRGYHLPLAFFAAENLGRGRLPLWDASIYCGFPFYANVNSQLFYPLAWPFFALGNVFGLDSLGKLLDWETALHIWLGGVFAYLLLRRLALGRGASILGATVYELGGYFTSQTQHTGAVCGAAWMPLAWFGVVALAEGFTVRRLAILAIALGMSFLAGFPATALVVFGTTAMLAALLVALRRARISLLLWTAGACAWAILLSGIQFLPTLNISKISIAGIRAKWYVAGGAPLQALVSLVAPNHYHQFYPDRYTFPFNLTFMYVYCSLFGLALALAAIPFSRHRLRTPFAILTVLSGAWFVSSNLPVIGKYYARIPAFLRGPMYPEFAMAAFVLGIAVLAAFGAERFVAVRGRLAMGALILLTAADLTAWGSGRYMNTAWANPYATVTTRSFEGSAPILTRMRELTARTFPRARFDVIRDSSAWTSSPQIMHLQTASGNEPLALLRILRLRQCFGRGNEWERYWEVSNYDSKLLDALNIRYLLAWAGHNDLPRPGHLVFAESMGSRFIYENTTVLPRFYLVGGVRRTHDFEESRAAVCSAEFAPAREAVVEGAGELSIPAGPEDRGTVKALRYTPNEAVLEVDAKAPAFLATSETFYPGWRAEVNGRAERIWMTNGAFRGLPVPAGRSRVRMVFRPADLFYGAAMTLAGCALLAVVALRERRKAAESRRSGGFQPALRVP